MARTLAFDRKVAVQGARTVFWSKGFEASSIPELEEATGLSRSSIYNSFGSKRGLFDAAVHSYLEEIVRPRLRPLLAADVEPSALGRYLDSLAVALGHPGSLPAANGCLLVNSANSPISADEAVSAVVGAYRQEMHDALGRGLGAARPDLDAARHALLTDTVTGLVIAAFALVRVSRTEAVRLVRCAAELVDR
ncbi:TetR/AcrR family transcriptional regulator [Glutamicibacter sp. MNS18]|uniref:TetR/AcrR family transcriptional regulator n=1 Tax=Glutamicibacter sp. MNS18 TaxID=2989817 RepID=UPI00223645F6|nr:TetR/AcrR family transcriptional regulator [Glutamicibacter sp. MNS18]MCW4464981.1 TetR/AcrR family transcriptional regulator [Glutamicibacter sp. MNS18]